MRTISRQRFKKLYLCAALLLLLTHSIQSTPIGAAELPVSQQLQYVLVTQSGTKTPSGITTSNSIKLNINNQQISLNNVLIYNNRTFLKVREITEKINADITYVQSAETEPNSLMGIAVISAQDPNNSSQSITLEIPIGYSKLVKIVKDKNTNTTLSTSTIYIDSQDAKVKSFSYNDYTYLPLRAVAESLNYTVNYDNNTSTIHINDNSHPYTPSTSTQQPTNPSNNNDENICKGETKPNYNGKYENEPSSQGNWLWSQLLKRWTPCNSKTWTSTADGNGDHTQILH